MLSKQMGPERSAVSSVIPTRSQQVPQLSRSTYSEFKQVEHEHERGRADAGAAPMQRIE